MHAVIVRPRWVGAMVMRPLVLGAVVVRRRGVCGGAGSRRMSRMRIAGGPICRLIGLIDVRTLCMCAALPSDPVVGVTPWTHRFRGMTAIVVHRRAIADGRHGCGRIGWIGRPCGGRNERCTNEQRHGKRVKHDGLAQDVNRCPHRMRASGFRQTEADLGGCSALSAMKDDGPLRSANGRSWNAVSAHSGSAAGVSAPAMQQAAQLEQGWGDSEAPSSRAADSTQCAGSACASGEASCPVAVACA
ncbi:hypothetical protein [Methyloversatilis sp.]|uniref:hypothetical protein n=1 Tax=Methyloversatilis sp. TaxID=2569862 RepID=UPI003F6EF94D